MYDALTTLDGLAGWWTPLVFGDLEQDEKVIVRFRLQERASDETLLQFRHEGLIPLLDCYDVCGSGWERFLASSADYAETGTGDSFR